MKQSWWNTMPFRVCIYCLSTILHTNERADINFSYANTVLILFESTGSICFVPDALNIAYSSRDQNSKLHYLLFFHKFSIVRLFLLHFIFGRCVVRGISVESLIFAISRSYVRSAFLLLCLFRFSKELGKGVFHRLVFCFSCVKI